MRALYTITNSTAYARFQGNSVTVAFTVPFQFFEPSTLRVRLAVGTVAVVQTLDADYTVAGGSGATGTVTFATAPPTGTNVVIDLNMPFTQETIDLAPNGPLPAEDVEQGFDRVVTTVKQLNADLATIPRMDITFDPGADSAPTFPPPASGQLLIGKTDGLGWRNVPPSDIANLDVPTVISGAAMNDELVYDGASWVNVPSMEKNAKWYGAVGDGVTDDTLALQTWFAAGGALVLPAGTYKITAALTTTAAGTSLRSAGKATIVTGAAMTTAAIRAWADDFSLDNIIIDASASPSIYDGVHVAGHRYAVRGLTVIGGQYRPWLPGTYPGPYYNLRVGASSGYAMYDDGVIDNFTASGGGTGAGLYVAGGKRLKFSKIKAIYCAGWGAIVGGGLSVQNLQIGGFEAISCGMYGFSNSAQFGATGIDPRAMSDWSIIGADVAFCGWRSALDGKYGAIGSGKYGYDITDGSLDGFYFRGSARDCCVGGLAIKGSDFGVYYDSTINTTTGTASGRVLNFASTSAVYVGMVATGTNIPADTYVASKTSTTVTLTRDVSGAISSSAAITFRTGVTPAGHKNANVDFNYIATIANANYSSQGMYALLEDSTSDQFFSGQHKLRGFATTKQAVPWRSGLFRYPYECMASSGLSWLCMGSVTTGQGGTTGQTAPSASGKYTSRLTNAATASGAVLSFADVTDVAAGMIVFGTNIPDGTYVQSVDGGAKTVTLTQSVTGSGVANGARVIAATLSNDGGMYWLCLGTDTSGLATNSNQGFAVNCASKIDVDVTSIGCGVGVLFNSTRGAANAIDDVTVRAYVRGAIYGVQISGAGVVTNANLVNCDVMATVPLLIFGTGTNNVNISGGRYVAASNSAVMSLFGNINNIFLDGGVVLLNSVGRCIYATGGTNAIRIGAATLRGGANSAPPNHFNGASTTVEIWWGQCIIINDNNANQFGGWSTDGSATVTSHGGPFRQDLTTNPNTGPKKGNVGEHMTLDTPTSTIWGYVCTVADTTWKAKTLA